MRTLEHWQEWKEKCALALCGDEARRELPGFVYARFARYVDAYVRATNAGPATTVTPAVGETWHRFETHFCIHAQTGGKSYKDWLFTQVEGKRFSAQESVEAGATALVRDVVREYLRSEYSSSRVVSTSAGIAGTDGSALTVEDLLPAGTDTGGCVEEKELDRIAQADAEGAFARLDRRERIALFVHEGGLSLAHPEALKAADCSKSSLNNAFRSALAQVAGHVREKHPHEDREVQASLACRTFEQVRHHTFRWGRLEKACARLCMVIEAHNSETSR